MRSRSGIVALLVCAAARAQSRPIDTPSSKLTVHVFKAGMFSTFGHDHVIDAPIASGTADTTALRVELRVRSAALRVTDPKNSESDRAGTQKTMTGPDVLDVGRFPEIVFQSTAAEPKGPAAWRVQGNLTIHGETKPVTVDVTEKDGHYLGSAVVKQTDFGIKPVRVAGGTVRVKDEVRIEFDVRLAQ
ncbi:MAG TPA: YceI family protein [Candidatus Acidoferrales bacterium]|nr:YceI family protein [Bryobacteraceae bacterium]HTS67128.1 YceI family protein [Candidatus Acidoferrales bacterium]